MEQFIKSFQLGQKKKPLRQYVAEISVKQEDTFVTSRIFNTREETVRQVIDPVWDYFTENREKLLRNSALVMQQLKKKDADKEKGGKK